MFRILQLASIFADFNGWNFQWSEQIFNQLNFFAYFCQAQWLENLMVEQISNGWIRLLKCILSNGWNDSDWLKLFVRYLCISKIWTLIEVFEKGLPDNYEFFYQIVNSYSFGKICLYSYQADLKILWVLVGYRKYELIDWKFNH